MVDNTREQMPCHHLYSNLQLQGPCSEVRLILNRHLKRKWKKGVCAVILYHWSSMVMLIYTVKWKSVD